MTRRVDSRGSGRDEVDEFLDGPQQRHLDIGVPVDAREHAPPHLARSLTPRAAQIAVLPVSPARHVRPSSYAERRRFDGLPDVDVWMAGDEDRGQRTAGADSATMRDSLLPGDEMVDQHAEPATRPGANARTCSARSSMPSRGSTTTPSTRRSSPQMRSSRAASCTPSTQMRLARATRAPASGTAIEPDAVRARVGLVVGATAGRTSVTAGRPP